MKRTPIILLASFLFLFVIAILPIPIPPYLDFQVIYHADMGLSRGISIYDHAGQVNMIAGLAHVLPAQVYVLPFPYPPWYALVTLPLAWLPITVAARLWFGLNLLMLFASIWLLTDGWESRKRLASFPLALLFWPVLGSLFIGQYGFPVLLGGALFGYALQKQKTGLAAVSAALLTFKPHLGMLVLLIGLISLFSRRDRFGRRALIATVIVGVILFGIGFLASPLWPVDYFRSLTGFKDVSQCHQCNNVAMKMAALFGDGFNLAVGFAIVLFVILIGWLIWQRHALLLQPYLLVASAVTVILLASPYLQNYDYILLLVPIFAMASKAHRFEWTFVVGAYVLPILGLAIFGVTGEVSLVLSTLVIFLLQAVKVHQLDVSRRTAYNPNAIE